VAGTEEIRERVRAHLEALGIRFDDGADNTFKVEAGTTAVYIDVAEAEGQQVVRMVAPVLADVEPQSERLAQLLQLNADLTFGKFSWLPDQRVIPVDYELLGDAVDAEEIKAALMAVGRIADTCDDVLGQSLGGRPPHG
jgi:hypothetical protein